LDTQDLEAHTPPRLFDPDCLEVRAGDYMMFRQTGRSTRLMVGPDASGKIWSIAVDIRGEVGLPITGWPSKPVEIRRYEAR
jgi:hypothetical protein